MCTAKSVESRLPWFMVLTIVILSYGPQAEAKYSGGTGEPNDPYQIAAAEDLIQDERAASDWIELEIDKDGTYLFFGDVDDAEPALLGPPEEHILPGGIGLSKKWHF